MSIYMRGTLPTPKQIKRQKRIKKLRQQMTNKDLTDKQYWSIANELNKLEHSN